MTQKANNEAVIYRRKALFKSIEHVKKVNPELLQQPIVVDPLYLAYILKNIIILQCIVEPQKLDKHLVNQLERLYMETNMDVELEIYYLIGLYFQTYETENIIELLKILEDNKKDIYI